MCRWCRKLEPILARESYPFPLRPLTPHFHALHSAASHRLGIFYRNRLMIMTGLLLLVEPLGKWHLDMGLIEEVGDEIAYLTKGLERHPVERDEERGWRAVTGKRDKGKGRKVVEEEGEEEEGSEVRSETSRSAVVSGRGRDDSDEDDEGESAGPADEDAEGEEAHASETGSTHGPHAEPSEARSRHPSTHASQPRPAPAPRTPPPTPTPPLPRLRLRNPWRASIEDLVAAKVLEHLAQQNQAAAGVAPLGPPAAVANRAHAPDAVRAGGQTEDGARALPAAGPRARRSERRPATRVAPGGRRAPKGENRRGLRAWWEAVTAAGVAAAGLGGAEERLSVRRRGADAGAGGEGGGEARYVNGARAEPSVVGSWSARSCHGSGSGFGRGSGRSGGGGDRYSASVSRGARGGGGDGDGRGEEEEEEEEGSDWDGSGEEDADDGDGDWNGRGVVEHERVCEGKE